MNKIQRHKTAIRRYNASLPIRTAIRHGIISTSTSIFDYGCGHGEDLDFLTENGFEAVGWDPAYKPDEQQISADIVNLGYVINVIEDPEERIQVLLKSWELSRKVLIVSAQILVSSRGHRQIEYGDGVITKRGTFQKFFTQSELREYLEGILGAQAISASPGIFYAFKDELLRETFLSSRYRRSGTVQRKSLSLVRFEKHRELLEPLLAKVEEFGRLPEPDEFGLSPKLVDVFGSLKRAYSVIKRVVGDDSRQSAANTRREDLLVYLALARFGKRPRIGKLPLSLQRDIRAFFGSYKKACSEADSILFQAGDPDSVDTACRGSTIGKLLPNALYVHRSAVESLSPLLRVYEGCGRAFIGEVEEANIIKIHRFSGKISYLVYPDFDEVAHPALVRSFKVSLRTQTIDCYDYSKSENPPILHRKETILDHSYPLFEKFSKLSAQEERHGLLSETSRIGTRKGWEERLNEKCLMIQGHRVIQVPRTSE